MNNTMTPPCSEPRRTVFFVYVCLTSDARPSHMTVGVWEKYQSEAEIFPTIIVNRGHNPAEMSRMAEAWWDSFTVDYGGRREWYWKWMADRAKDVCARYEKEHNDE